MRYYLVGDMAYPERIDGAAKHGHLVAVIDPEDDEQVGRLARKISGVPAPFESRIDDLRAALREYADPTPEPPPEPTSLAARVTDKHGQVWALLRGERVRWVCLTDARRRRTWYELLNWFGPLTVEDES